jgi:hypothetical protein
MWPTYVGAALQGGLTVIAIAEQALSGTFAELLAM